MRQVMPHRNNMCMRCSEGKNILRRGTGFQWGATILQQPSGRRRSPSKNNIKRNKSLCAASKFAGVQPQRIEHG
jgi:hypothetical protein